MELNPNHPTVKAMRGQWHKIAALLLWKFSKNKSEAFTPEDIIAFGQSDERNITISTEGDIMRVSLVDDKDALRLAKENK